MVPIERITGKLEAPELDDRSYRVIRLPNKLEALLVHDAESDKASASVNGKIPLAEPITHKTNYP